MFIWSFPYLPLAERMTVGPWILIPSAALSEEDTGSAAVTERALGLGALYRMPGDRRGSGRSSAAWGASAMTWTRWHSVASVRPLRSRCWIRTRRR